MATSFEHAPPKCLFPRAEDTENGTNHRRNLITVPSCAAHNSAKSHDDEYLLQVLSASYTSNAVGLKQFVRKVGRSFDDAPTKASRLIARSAPVKLRRVEQPEWEDGLQVIVEGERLDDVLSNCARALYFKETGKKFQGPAQVITGFTMYTGTPDQASVDQGIAATEAYFNNQPPRGQNPEVFWYKFEEGEQTAMFLLCFYGHSIAIVRFKKIHVSR